MITRPDLNASLNARALESFTHAWLAHFEDMERDGNALLNQTLQVWSTNRLYRVQRVRQNQWQAYHHAPGGMPVRFYVVVGTVVTGVLGTVDYERSQIAQPLEPLAAYLATQRALPEGGV